MLLSANRPGLHSTDDDDKSLIGSVLDYSSFICSGLSDELTSALQVILSAAVRAIYHVPRKDRTPTDTLCSMARMEELNRRYLPNAIRTNNPLIEEAVVGYIAGIGNVNTEKHNISTE